MALIKHEKVIRPIPHGANPDDYVSVRSADGIIYRRKRSKGTLLNAVCKKNQSKLQLASSLSRQIRKALLPFIDKKLKETLHYRLNGRLMTGIKPGNRVDLDVLHGFNLLDTHRDKRVKPLLLSVSSGKEMIKVNRLLNAEVVKKKEKLLNQFRLKVLVIYLNEDGETAEVLEQLSPNFSLDDEPYEAWSCPIALQPNRKYLICLKAECMSGEWVYHHQQAQYFRVLQGG
jgi:hypothetical protein